MKYTFCMVILFAAISVHAQMSCGISFDYDAAGNRIKRYPCYSGAGSLLGSDTDAMSATSASALPVSGKTVLYINPNCWREETTELSATAIPNPTTAHLVLHVCGFSKEPEVLLFDSMGRLILRRLLGDGDFDLSPYADGFYQFLICSDKLSRTVHVVKTNQ